MSVFNRVTPNIMSFISHSSWFLRKLTHRVIIFATNAHYLGRRGFLGGFRISRSFLRTIEMRSGSKTSGYLQIYIIDRTNWLTVAVFCYVFICLQGNIFQYDINEWMILENTNNRDLTLWFLLRNRWTNSNKRPREQEKELLREGTL